MHIHHVAILKADGSEFVPVQPIPAMTFEELFSGSWDTEQLAEEEKPEEEKEEEEEEQDMKNLQDFNNLRTSKDPEELISEVAVSSQPLASSQQQLKDMEEEVELLLKGIAGQVRDS